MDLFQQVGQPLFEQLDIMTLQPATILDVGADSGLFVEQLKSKYPQAKILVDTVNGISSLNYDNNSIDLIFSNLGLFNAKMLDSALTEIKRLLSSNGLFIFSMLGLDSLKELAQSWQSVDNYAHVNQFVDMHNIGDLLLQKHFADPVMQRQQHLLTYSHLSDLLLDIKTVAIPLWEDNKNKGLTGKETFNKVLQNYQQLQTEDNKLPLSLEIIYGHAWGSNVAGGNKKTEQGDVEVTIDNISRI